MNSIKILILCLASGLSLNAQFGGGGFSSGASLWEISSSKLVPKTSTAFTQTFQGYSIVNDYIDVGADLPYVGIFGKSLADYKALNGYVDASGVGFSDLLILGYTDFQNGKFNNIEIIDTTGININARGTLNIFSIGDMDIISDNDIGIDCGNDLTLLSEKVLYLTSSENITINATTQVSIEATEDLVLLGRGNEAQINANGFILPSIGTEPTGENGAMYYSTSLNKFRLFENGAWRDL